MQRNIPDASWNLLKDFIRARRAGYPAAEDQDGRERQAAIIQERYGVSREVALKLLDNWEKNLRH